MNSKFTSNMGYSSIDELLLADVSQDDLDYIFGFCDALGPHAKECAKVAFQWQDAFEDGKLGKNHHVMHYDSSSEQVQESHSDILKPSLCDDATAHGVHQAEMPVDGFRTPLPYFFSCLHA